MEILSAIICDEYQELISEKSNYINAGNTFYLDEESIFDFVIQWYGINEIIVEKTVLIDPNENIINATEQEIILKGIEVSIIEYEVEFIEPGLHWILVYENDIIVKRIPIDVMKGD